MMQTYMVSILLLVAFLMIVPPPAGAGGEEPEDACDWANAQLVLVDEPLELNSASQPYVGNVVHNGCGYTGVGFKTTVCTSAPCVYRFYGPITSPPNICPTCE